MVAYSRFGSFPSVHSVFLSSRASPCTQSNMHHASCMHMTHVMHRGALGAIAIGGRFGEQVCPASPCCLHCSFVGLPCRCSVIHVQPRSLTQFELATDLVAPLPDVPQQHSHFRGDKSGNRSACSIVAISPPPLVATSSLFVIGRRYLDRC